MPESTLSLTYADLEARVGKFLGYGRGLAEGDPAWDRGQQKDIDDCLQSGLRQFYFPTASVTGPVYDWSFLKPWAKLDLGQGAQAIALPDDFGGFEGQIAILNSPGGGGTGQIPWALELKNSGFLHMQYAAFPDRTGRPLLAALEPLKGNTQQRGQRQQLTVFPIADAPYQLNFQYYVLPDYLTTANPFHWGGGAHAETVMEACLMAAEQFLDNASEVHAMKFQERLTASIGVDQKNKPQRFGVNEDRSDGRVWKGRDWRGWMNGLGLYNGLSMD